jgi:hypothetical protein
MGSRPLRAAFNPEALSVCDQILEEVWKELLMGRVLDPRVSEASRMRTRVAQRVLAVASSGWTDIQIKQLLLRSFRNEANCRQRVQSARQCNLPSGLAVD